MFWDSSIGALEASPIVGLLWASQVPCGEVWCVGLGLRVVLQAGVPWSFRDASFSVPAFDVGEWALFSWVIVSVA